MNNSKKKGAQKKGVNKNELIILVDSHSICHMVKHTMKGLSDREKATGIIYGFMIQIIGMAERFNTNRFCFAWDSRKKKRLEIYSEYKGNRPGEYTEEDLKAFEQFGQIRTAILPALGFKNVFIQTGYEADDIIGSITNMYWEKKIVIISRDSDLFQCLSDSIFMWHPTPKKRFTKKDFTEKYKMAPFQWADVKAIAGDTSDNIKGIPDIGEVRACKYVRGELNERWTNLIKTNGAQHIIKRNKKLVTLPYSGTKVYEFDWNEIFYISDFIGICKQYNFRSLLTGTEMRKWTERFGMI